MRYSKTPLILNGIGHAIWNDFVEGEPERRGQRRDAGLCYWPLLGEDLADFGPPRYGEMISAMVGVAMIGIGQEGRQSHPRLCRGEGDGEGEGEGEGEMEVLRLRLIRGDARARP